MRAKPFDRYIARRSSGSISGMKPNQRIVTLNSTMSIIRFDVREDGEGWTIYDRLTDEPACVEGEKTVGLSGELSARMARRSSGFLNSMP